MVLFNYATRELTAKIVYYGAGLCGKTTNLEHIHKSLPEKSRGKMLSLATQTDRTLFFDFLPLDLGSIKGMKTRVQLYTVPGQVFYDATRKLVLKGADAVVFVVDSQKEMLDSNIDSWENLKQNLSENNLDINNIPLVIQYNKRDLPNVLPIKELNRSLNVLKAPHFEAVALTGIGVQETLKGIAKIVMKTLAKRYARDEKEEAEAVNVPEIAAPIPSVAGSTHKLPADETPDLSAFDEEVKELPRVEEFEAVEDSPIHLEPVESGEDSASLGQVEDVPELHDSQELQEFHEDLQEIHELPEVPVQPIPPVSTKKPVDSKPPELPRPALSDLDKLLSGTRKKADRIPEASAVVSALTESIASFKDKHKTTGRLREQEPARKEESAVTATATATVASQDINVPIEISVGREGQDIKLQISLTLKIRLKD